MLSQKDVERWLRPYPIEFRKRRASWSVEVRTIQQCMTIRCFWRLDGGALHTVAWWANQVAKGTAPAEQSPIRSLAVHAIPTMRSLTVMVVKHKGEEIAVDGNHRLIALVLIAKHRWQKLRTGITHVGIVRRR